MNDRLLSRYIAGECTAEEKRRVERWVAQDPAHQAELDELRALWDEAEKPEPAWDVEAAWARTVQRFDAVPKRKKEPAARPAKRRGRRARRSPVRNRRASWSRFVVPAVVVLIAVGIAYGVQEFAVPNAEQGPEAVSHEVTTERGERTRVELSDGTVVHLNADSEMQYPASFNAGQRRVHLKGEAYFEVVPDSARPFLVTTAQATVRVLGTAFTVESYDDRVETQVAVREGRVEVAPVDRSASRPESIIIEAGQLGRVDATGALTHMHPETVRPYFGWLDNQLIFREEPLRDVARRLERWYDVEVQIADPEIAQRRLTATFERESLDEALDALALALRVAYEREDHAITFYADSPDGVPRH